MWIAAAAIVSAAIGTADALRRDDAERSPHGPSASVRDASAAEPAPRAKARMVRDAAAAAVDRQASGQRKSFRYGPILIDGYETRRRSAAVPAPPGDGFLTRMRAVVVDALGREVPQQRVMLHHVLFMNSGRVRGERRSRDCRTRMHEKFYGTGEEDQELVLPRGYGYRVRKGDRWRMSWMLMNHTHRQERVYLKYTVTLAKGPVTPVVPYWVTLGCRQAKIFNVPGGRRPGGVYRRSRSWTVPQDGRVVAAAGHAHGGALGIAMSERRCGSRRRMLSSAALYGASTDPIYRLSPVLHEPSPRSLSVVTSATGWPVRRGQRLRMTAYYDAERPHVAVMGIMHLYIARSARRPASCPAPPQDVRAHRLRFPGYPGRVAPPRVVMDLSARSADGRARPISDLPGPTRTVNGNGTVTVRGFAFSPRKLSVPNGATVRWRFSDRVAHDVTLANGPRGFASKYLKHGLTYRQRLTVPGIYKLFCSLHPVDMAQIIDVRG